MLLVALGVLSGRNSRVRGHFRAKRPRSDHSPAALAPCAECGVNGREEGAIVRGGVVKANNRTITRQNFYAELSSGMSEPRPGGVVAMGRSLLEFDDPLWCELVRTLGVSYVDRRLVSE